ncbi:hypothetical protein QLH32_02165 [Acinetobacter corruptisaponis]|uniref:Uncharacterized protein n=1 Tax=Acinetobacter corruptisaponis TaxID=3045147 RepID=A0ABY8S618_9GAMM|nr:hypothetical protein [Acinetobacter sp. KCTC 92772]WHP06297.1 hypothetical protein QLH32_02165 [Acinetobacter sp. KCTC 92772]
MSKNQHLRLLEKYKEYANTEESRAVIFIKEHLRKAAGHWIDIDYCESYELSKNKFHFKLVQGGLYKRKLKPKYPPKSEFTVNGKFDEERYDQIVRAITWETAHLDIEQQKMQSIKPINFEVAGVRYDKNRNSGEKPEFVYKIKYIRLN